MLLCELCEIFPSSSLTVFNDGVRVWFGRSYDLPSALKYSSVYYADAIPRKEYRTNQTDLYLFIRK